MTARKNLMALALCGLIAAGCNSDNNPLAPIEDDAPPSAPQNLSHVSDNLGYRITWSASPEPTVVGYHVYRYDPSPERESAYTQITSTAISSTWFAIPIEEGETTYRLRAVNSKGKQSGMSSKLTVVSGNGGSVDGWTGDGSLRRP